MRTLRYLVSGSIGLSVNLGLYRALVQFVHAQYLVGSVIAVSVSTIVGFLLQKYWTFEERSHERAPLQFTLYALIAILNIGLNTLVVFILVNTLGAHYLLAQATAAGVVALGSFFVYREVIFKKKIEGSAPPAPLL